MTVCQTNGRKKKHSVRCCSNAQKRKIFGLTKAFTSLLLTLSFPNETVTKRTEPTKMCSNLVSLQVYHTSSIPQNFPPKPFAFVKKNPLFLSLNLNPHTHTHTNEQKYWKKICLNLSRKKIIQPQFKKSALS